jgi:hypothetical protein
VQRYKLQRYDILDTGPEEALTTSRFWLLRSLGFQPLAIAINEGDHGDFRLV